MTERELFDFAMQAANLFFWVGCVVGAGATVVFMQMLGGIADWWEDWADRQRKSNVEVKP